MNVKQFEYKPLAHFSYAIVSNGEMAVIDPERNPKQYYAFAKENNAKIVAVIETHSHADFVSSHLEIHKMTGAPIYNSEKLDAVYPFQSFDEGSHIAIGDVSLKAINTPGHSKDSITIVAINGNSTVLFTGDTLLIGDVGRPDLRGEGEDMDTIRKELAEMMYHSIQNKFTQLPNDALVYPAHGAGSLCGKNMSDDKSSTLGKERTNNWAFKQQTEQEFLDKLLDDQSMIPSYFKYDVDLNKKGAAAVEPAIGNISFNENGSASGLIVDMRDEASFKNDHIKGSINIQAVSEDNPFETWLGSIVKPEEEFILVIDKAENKDEILHRVAKIGYENKVKQVITFSNSNKNLEKMEDIDFKDFKNNPDKYTIVDVRNKSEVEEEKYFKNALPHPLNELRDTFDEIPTNKPIVVHCGSGYRSAIGSSILQKKLEGATVFDLNDRVEEFK